MPLEQWISSTSGGRSVGIVRSRTKGHGVFYWSNDLSQTNTIIENILLIHTCQWLFHCAYIKEQWLQGNLFIAISLMTGYWPDSQGVGFLVLVSESHFINPHRPYGFWYHSSSYLMDNGDSFHGIKWHYAEYTSSIKAEVKNTSSWHNAYLFLHWL
jgi:hypothetical protein